MAELDYVLKDGPAYNIPFAICQMPNGQETFGFINFRDTFKGTGEDPRGHRQNRVELTDGDGGWRSSKRQGGARLPRYNTRGTYNAP